MPLKCASLAGLALAGLTALLAACGAAPAVPLPVKVRVATTGAALEAGMFLAQDRGYFQHEELDVQFVPNLTNPDINTGLLSGSLDVGSIAVSASLFNAAERGVSLRAFAPESYLPANDKNGSIVVRKDLIDSGQYHGPADLKGKTIAFSQLLVERTLALGGLGPNDVQFVTMSFPDELTALASKKVDAGWEGEPLATVGEEKGIATEVIWAGQLLPNLDAGLLIESPAFAAAHADALDRFAAAQLRGQRDYYALFQKQAGGQNARDETCQTLMKYTSVKDLKTWQDLSAKGRMPSVEPNDQLHLAGLDTLQDFFLRQGVVTTRIDVNSIIDAAPVAYALQQLGRTS